MLMPSIFGENLFDDFFTPFYYDDKDEKKAEKKLYGHRAQNLLKTDIKETKEGYELVIDVPGFKKDEISVDCEDGYVTISAEKNTENEEKDENKKYIKRERFYGKTVRKFYVGDVDSDKIQAEYKDGMLELVVPKEEKLPNKKSIEIK